MMHSRLIRWIYYRFTQKAPTGGEPGLLAAKLNEQPPETIVQPTEGKDGVKWPKMAHLHQPKDAQ